MPRPRRGRPHSVAAAAPVSAGPCHSWRGGRVDVPTGTAEGPARGRAHGVCHHRHARPQWYAEAALCCLPAVPAGPREYINLQDDISWCMIDTPQGEPAIGFSRRGAGPTSASRANVDRDASVRAVPRREVVERLCRPRRGEGLGSGEGRPGRDGRGGACRRHVHAGAISRWRAIRWGFDYEETL